MALTKNRSDLVGEALQKLGVLAAGQAVPYPEDYARVDESVESCLAYMAADKIAYIPNPESIPIGAFNFIADVLADFCKSKFGKSGNNDLSVLAEQAKRILKKMYFNSQPIGELRVDSALLSGCR